MYDLMENEDVYWENKTHATDLFGQRAIEIIKKQVLNRFFGALQALSESSQGFSKETISVYHT